MAVDVRPGFSRCVSHKIPVYDAGTAASIQAARIRITRTGDLLEQMSSSACETKPIYVLRKAVLSKILW